MSGDNLMKRMIFLALLLAALSASIDSAVAGTYTTQTLTVGVRKNMEATLYTPDGPGPFPMVLVLHTSSGISSVDQGYCGNLAKEGYICIAPAFLRAYGITEETRRLSFTREAREITTDFIEIIGELNALPKAKKGAVGAVGFSNGGFFTMILASTNHIKAGVSYYGALDGARAHPDLKPFQERFTSASAPVLILAGENDTTIGKEPPKKLAEILDACGARYELKFYPDAEHGFDRSSTRPGNRAAAADAWPRTLAFLRANGV
jgi:carboxymethylenebutenolidase